MSLLASLDSIADATPEQHEAARRVLETAAPDLLPFVFGEPHSDAAHAHMLAALTTARRNGTAVRADVADPAQTSATGDIGPFRALVCDWGRVNGWPHADSRQPLDPDMLAAYRAAKAKGAS